MKYITATLLSFGLFVCVACDDDDPAEPQGQEFVATDANFAAYREWPQTVSPRSGADPAGLVGTAHEAGNQEMTRHIFINDNAVTRDGNGNYPNGTRLVKEVRRADGSVAVVTGMVKRGGSFNSANRGWEWFMLDSDGKITSRGANLFNNGCNGCHAAGASKDYVFTK